MEELIHSDYPRLAVITGASSGIGLELASIFAANDYDLMLCSNSDQINDVEFELNNFNVDLITCQVDLATARGVKYFYREIKRLNRPVDVLVIHAGAGIGGELPDKDLQDEFHLMRLNIMSPIHLSKLVTEDMVREGAGKILFTSSLWPSLPSPYEAIYGATRAFVESFAESLRAKLKDHGITVSVLLCDSIENDPAKLAQQGFDALMAGKCRVVAASP